MCSELKWVINQVAFNNYACKVGVFLLGTMINHNAGIGDCSIAWGVANISMQKKKDGVGAFGNASTFLSKAMELFPHCLEPQLPEQGIFDQLSVMCDGFFGDRVYHTIAVFFDFNYRACMLMVGKFSQD